MLNPKINGVLSEVADALYSRKPKTVSPNWCISTFIIVPELSVKNLIKAENGEILFSPFVIKSLSLSKKRFLKNILLSKN